MHLESDHSPHKSTLHHVEAELRATSPLFCPSNTAQRQQTLQSPREPQEHRQVPGPLGLAGWGHGSHLELSVQENSSHLLPPLSPQGLQPFFSQTYFLLLLEKSSLGAQAMQARRTCPRSPQYKFSISYVFTSFHKTSKTDQGHVCMSIHAELHYTEGKEYKMARQQKSNVSLRRPSFKL